MSVNELIAVVPPPTHPVDPGTDLLRQQVEEKLGLRLPQDIIDFSLTYGTGTFSHGQFWVFNPFSRWYYSNIEEVCRLFRKLRRDEGPGRFPYNFHPERPGLLSWGSESNGHEMFWLTEGEPNAWPIILYDRVSFERWDLSVTTFLAKFFKCEISCILLGEDTQRRLHPEFDPG